MIHFLGSILSVAMLELSIELLSSPLTEAHVHYTITVNSINRNTCALSKVYVKQHLEALCLFLWWGSHYNTDSLLIRNSAGSRYFVAVAILNMYSVHDLNGLNIYTLRTVHEQDSLVARHKRQTIHMLLLACYTACNMIHAYISHVLLMSISQISWVTHMRVSSLNWAVLYTERIFSATYNWRYHE